MQADIRDGIAQVRSKPGPVRGQDLAELGRVHLPFCQGPRPGGRDLQAAILDAFLE